uniref:60S ribosomal protein L28 n=1 Tax=Anopheles gambiae TaxID=7165 RepID=A0ABK8FFY3_ANOGA
MASSHLNWLIVRDHNAFLLKRRDIRKPFSTNHPTSL